MRVYLPIGSCGNVVARLLTNLQHTMDSDTWLFAGTAPNYSLGLPKMSDEELRVVNAFIGFCIPTDSTWPCPFKFGQYEITGLEHPIQVAVNGQIRSPTPELIATSANQRHCVLLEAKSGSVNDTQARGYAAVTPGTLISQALASPKHAG